MTQEQIREIAHNFELAEHEEKTIRLVVDPKSLNATTELRAKARAFLREMRDRQQN